MNIFSSLFIMTGLFVDRIFSLLTMIDFFKEKTVNPDAVMPRMRQISGMLADVVHEMESGQFSKRDLEFKLRTLEITIRRTRQQLD